MNVIVKNAKKVMSDLNHEHSSCIRGVVAKLSRLPGERPRGQFQTSTKMIHEIYGATLGKI